MVSVREQALGVGTLLRVKHAAQNDLGGTQFGSDAMLTICGGVLGVDLAHEPEREELPPGDVPGGVQVVIGLLVRS